MFDYSIPIYNRLQALWDTKKIQTGSVFIFFNVFMPLYDLTSDLVAAVELLHKNHLYWCLITFYWMFNPFIFILFLFIIKLFKKSGYNLLLFIKKLFTKSVYNSNDFINVLLHFPFFLPLTNSILAIHLISADLTNPKNAGTIEMIKRTAAMSGLYESYLESGPQLLTQIHIILSTGRRLTSQYVLIAGHVFTLTLKACKAFYVHRKSSESDPAPEFKMLVLLFPLMLINILNGTAQWTVIIGLLKFLLPLLLFVIPFLTWLLMKKMQKKETTSYEDKNDIPMIESGLENSENTRRLGRRFSLQFSSTSEDEDYQDSKASNIVEKLATVAGDTGNDEGFFSLKAAITSCWLPCVVGDNALTFTISAFFSLFIRSFFLIGAVIFSYRDWYPDYFQEHSFLIHCITNETLKNIGEELLNETLKNENLRNDPILRNISFFNLWKNNSEYGIKDRACDSWDACFTMKIENMPQLHRVCGETNEIPVTMMGVLVHLILLSLMATYLLNRLTSYLHLYQISNVFFSFPIIHRSLIVQLIQNGKHEKLKEICDIVKKATEDESKDVDEVKETILDRQCNNGYSPLHIAVLGKDATCLRILLESGAKVQEDSTEKHPLTSAFAKDIVCFELMISYANKTQIRKAFKQAVESNNINYILTLLNHSQSFILYRSNILLGEKSQDQIIKKFQKTGGEDKDIRSITVNFNKMTWLAGLELVWSDGTEKVLGLNKNDKNVCNSVKVDAPQDRSFSFVRGQTSKQFIMAVAFDTMSSSGIVEPGEWIRSSVESKDEGKIVVVQPHSGEEVDAPKYKEVDTLGMLDIGDSPIRCVLDGFKGRLDANLVVADLLESAYDYRYFLTNLAATYRFVISK